MDTELYKRMAALSEIDVEAGIVSTPAEKKKKARPMATRAKGGSSAARKRSQKRRKAKDPVERAKKEKRTRAYAKAKGLPSPEAKKKLDKRKAKKMSARKKKPALQPGEKAVFGWAVKGGKKVRKLRGEETEVADALAYIESNLFEANPWHGRRDGKFSNKDKLRRQKGGSWSIKKRKQSVKAAGKRLVMDFAKKPCGRAARKAGDDIRCHDGKRGAWKGSWGSRSYSFSDRITDVSKSISEVSAIAAGDLQRLQNAMETARTKRGKEIKIGTGRLGFFVKCNRDGSWDLISKKFPKGEWHYKGPAAEAELTKYFLG